MAEQIALIESPVYEVTGADVPRVQHEFVAFEILGSPCRVRTSPDGDLLLLRFGQRDFAVSLLDLAATAALALEGQIKGEIRARIFGRRPPDPAPGPAPRPAPGREPVRSTAVIPLRGAVEADGVITLHTRGR